MVKGKPKRWFRGRIFHHRSAELQFGPVRTGCQFLPIGRSALRLPGSVPWCWYQDAPVLVPGVKITRACVKITHPVKTPGGMQKACACKRSVAGGRLAE